MLFIVVFFAQIQFSCSEKLFFYRVSGLNTLVLTLYKEIDRLERKNISEIKVIKTKYGYPYLIYINYFNY